MEQKPTIGRIVLYMHEYDVSDGSRSQGQLNTQKRVDTIPGIIVQLGGKVPVYTAEGAVEQRDHAVASIHCFGYRGYSPSGPVVDGVPYSPELKIGHWSWPPRS